MKNVATTLLSAACVLGLPSPGLAVSLNEVVVNDVSTDDREYVEICGTPGESLTAYRLVVIEGEGTGKGVIDVAIALTGVVPANGLYVVGDAGVTCANQTMAASTLENGGETILLVLGFTGSVGMDVDANDDCVAEGSIGTIVDGIGFAVPSSGDCTYYGVPVLGPDKGSDGLQNFDVAAAGRCGDCTGGWSMICLDGTEGAPVCAPNPANPDYIITHATPCAVNACPPISVEETSWGLIKGAYR
jgi:hypothetical protein